MSMSSACSATSFFRRWFSFSSSFRRLASSAFMPPYGFFQRCQVDVVISRALSSCPIVGSGLAPRVAQLKGTWSSSSTP